MKKILSLLLVVILTSCADSTPFQVLRGILGYIPPPEETSIAEELKSEFERCEKIDRNRNCAQIAYDMIRTVKGLEPRKVPEGVVIILEGDVDLEPKKDDSSLDSESDDK